MKLDVASLWNGHSNALSANFHFSTHKNITSWGQANWDGDLGISKQDEW